MEYRAYLKARKEGLKSYSSAIQSNRDPHLPVLEELVHNLNQLTRIPLGTHSVPLDAVRGSVSSGRSFAFAPNFMPILETDTEFADKWIFLYDSVAEEGLRDPVKVLEYLGEYYLIEGNKRVSVMKCLGGEYIEADVTRVMPERTEEPEIIAYYEYCAFSKKTRIYDLLFTQPGMYHRLSRLPGMHSEDQWTEDEVLTLRKIYHYFRTAYHDVLGEKKCMTVGDAFLLWIVAFGYEDVKNESLDQVTDRVRLMAAEFEIHPESVNLVMDHTQSAPQPSLIGSIFRPSRIKAAFLYTRDIHESAWCYWHELGRLEAESKMGDRLETVTKVVPSRTDTEKYLEELIHDGYTAIFATSPVMLNSFIEPSLSHPEAKLLVCSQLAGYNHVRTYYLRFWEGKFLLGMAAGILSHNGKIGYIADYPIFGAPSMINAFAAGARMVNPDAKIYLNWTSLLSFDVKEPFHDPDIKVICNRDLTAPNQDSHEAGLYIREKGECYSVAALIPRWGVFYRNVIEQIRDGSFDAVDTRKTALNYWWGLSSDTLDVAFSKRFDPYAVRLINAMKEQLRDGVFTPFEGEQRDQDKNIRCEANRRLSPAEVLCMDYLAENVIGSLPDVKELTESARPLIKLQGIHRATRPDASSINWTRK